MHQCGATYLRGLPYQPVHSITLYAESRGWLFCFFTVVSISVHRYQKAEVLERSLVEDFTTAEFRSSVHEVFKNAQAGIQTDNFEFPLYTKDGKCVYVLLNASSRSDRDGELLIHDQQQLLQVALHMPAPANL